MKLSYQKSSRLPTAVTHVSEPVLLILFPFCLSEEPYSEQSTFLSTWPRFTHTESWNVHNILLKYGSNMRGVTVVLSTCHSNPNSSLLFISPLGFSLLQTTATQPVTLTAKSRLCSEICMLPRKLEVRQPSLQQAAGVLKEKAVAKPFGWFIFILVSTHICISNFSLWVFNPHGQVVMQREPINSIVHKFYLNESWSSS